MLIGWFSFEESTDTGINAKVIQLDSIATNTQIKPIRTKSCFIRNSTKKALYLGEGYRAKRFKHNEYSHW